MLTIGFFIHIHQLLFFYLNFKDHLLILINFFKLFTCPNDKWGYYEPWQGQPCVQQGHEY